MEGIKNYRINFMDKTSINVDSETALAVMKSMDLGKKIVIIEGECFVLHQVLSVRRDFELEKDELYGLELTKEEKLSLDVRNLKHGNPQIIDNLKKLT